MNSLLPIRLLSIAVLGLVLFLSRTPAWAGEAKANWKAEWERVVTAAKKEGRVVVYGAAGLDREKVYKNDFEAVFPGIRVDYIVGGGVTRIMAERRAGKYIPDIFLGAASSSTFPSLRARGVYQSLRQALVLPEVSDESHWFEGKLWFADEEEKYSLIYSLAATTNIAVNTKLINPKEITSYKQLVDPKSRGKIVSQDVAKGGVGTGNIKFLYANQDLGPNFIRKLYGEMDVTLSTDSRQMVDWLARGRFAFHLFPNLRDVDNARAVGLPVDVVNPLKMKEGHGLTAGLNYLHLLNPAPHPNAAKVFINWLLSRDGQTAFEKILETPSLRVDLQTKSALRDFLVPKKGDNYIVVSLEKYWHLDDEIKPLLESLRK